MERAVEVHDHAPLAGRGARRRGLRDRFGHRLVLHALRPVIAFGHRALLFGLLIGGGMAAHALRKAVEVVVERTFEVAGDEGAIVRRQLRDRFLAPLRHRRGDPPRDVRGNHRPALRFRQLDERAVVGRISRPGAGGLERLLLPRRSNQIRVERRAHVPFEHFERHDGRHFAPLQAFEDRELEAVRVGIVMLLADEDDVGGRDVRQHDFEIGERLALRVVDTLGDVRGHQQWRSCRSGGLQKKERKRR